MNYKKRLVAGLPILVTISLFFLIFVPSAYIPDHLIEMSLLVAAFWGGILYDRISADKHGQSVEKGRRFDIKVKYIRLTSYLFLGILVLLYWWYSPIGRPYFYIGMLIIAIVAISLELFFENGTADQYVIIYSDHLYLRPGNPHRLELKTITSAELTEDYLVLYEKWAHHKIVFGRFENEQELRHVLLICIEEYGIPVKRNDKSPGIVSEKL
ncbi:MAG: hypothetical protein R2824_24615 [Saprospiraceae bacterium]|nr:hypothetical protein [Lewinella sp.]